MLLPILGTDQSLSSTSGAFLIYTLKSTLNYSRMLQPPKKEKSKQLDTDQMSLKSRSDQDLHWKLFHQIRDQQTAERDEQKKKKSVLKLQSLITLSWD